MIKTTTQTTTVIYCEICGFEIKENFGMASSNTGYRDDTKVDNFQKTGKDSSEYHQDCHFRAISDARVKVYPGSRGAGSLFNADAKKTFWQ